MSKKVFYPNGLRGQNGYSLLEVVIALGILLLITPFLFSIITNTSKITGDLGKNVQAVFYVQEAMEATYNYFAESWNEVGEGIYYPEFTGGQWELVLGEEQVGDFTRTVTISNVHRDAEGNLADSGTEDVQTKKVVVLIEWTSGGLSKQRQLVSYYSQEGALGE